jgi:hypothetical protein
MRVASPLCDTTFCGAGSAHIRESNMTEAARKALSSVVSFFSAEAWSRPAEKGKRQEEHRVGEYIADYSEVTAEQLNEPQPELDELFKDSKLISAKRES